MIGSLWDFFFGCAHSRTTFPITPRRNGTDNRRSEQANRTYIVCLDCGKEFPYSWEKMRILPAWRVPREPAAAHRVAAWFWRHHWPRGLSSR